MWITLFLFHVEVNCYVLWEHFCYILLCFSICSSEKKLNAAKETIFLFVVLKFPFVSKWNALIHVKQGKGWSVNVVSLFWRFRSTGVRCKHCFIVQDVYYEITQGFNFDYVCSTYGVAIYTFLDEHRCTFKLLLQRNASHLHIILIKPNTICLWYFTWSMSKKVLQWIIKN